MPDMNIQVRLAEPYWRAVGQRNLQIELSGVSNMSGLLDTLFQQYPKLSSEMEESTAILFVNEEEAEMDEQLEDGDRVHILWPIVGG